MHDKIKFCRDGPAETSKTIAFYLLQESLEMYPKPREHQQAVEDATEKLAAIPFATVLDRDDWKDLLGA